MENQERQRLEKPNRKVKLLKILILLLAIVGLVILIYPFFPAIKYKITGPKEDYPYPTLLNNDYQLKLPETNEKADNVNAITTPKIAGLPKDNRIVIAKIGVNAKIVEGANQNALWRGVWHIPNTSQPEKGGNTVISGHRFQYRPPNNTTFYLLDKLAKGDYLIVYWNGKEYDYKVAKTMVVGPKESSILENTTTPILTLFTCTPLFTTKQRLVVIGELIENK